MRVQRDRTRRLLGFARQMRHVPTDAENKMWWILRGRRLAGFKFRRHYPVAGYILDFYCVKARLAIELDGGQHGEDGNAAKDVERTKALQSPGVQVLRFWDDDVLKDPDIVADAIWGQLSN